MSPSIVRDGVILACTSGAWMFAATKGPSNCQWIWWEVV